MSTNRHALHFLFLRYMTGAGSCCINSRLRISWDCACLVTAYITSLEPHMAGLCSGFIACYIICLQLRQRVACQVLETRALITACLKIKSDLDSVALGVCCCFHQCLLTISLAFRNPYSARQLAAFLPLFTRFHFRSLKEECE